MAPPSSPASTTLTSASTATGSAPASPASSGADYSLAEARRLGSHLAMRALFIFFLGFVLASPAAAQLGGGERHIDVRLTGGIEGVKGTLALAMHPRPGWHGYWLNPGDAGQPTTVAWQLPQGAAAGP